MAKREPKKYCTGCGRWRRLATFDDRAHRVDGKCVWCASCVAELLKEQDRPKTQMRKTYREARRRAYQIWFREWKGTLMLDRRLLRSHGVKLRLVRSRRIGRIQAYDGWTMVESIRSMLLGVFGCDPATVIEHGRGGGIGVRRHPHCIVEGEASEEKWKAGLARLAEEGWTVLREDNEDVVAEGY